MKRRLLAVALLFFAGCSSEAGSQAAPGDGGDAANDASDATDGALDAPSDALDAGRDVTPDAIDDATSDATSDAIDDATSDATDAAWTCDPAQPVYPNEGLAEGPGTGGCPSGMLRVDTFCVDRYEASLERVNPVGGVTTWSPYFHPDGTPLRAVSVAGAVPQAYIDEVSAADACANAGKRLCSDAEWLRACRGASATQYPYGDQRVPGACNDARAQHPAIEYFGTSDGWIWSELGNACIDQLPSSLALTGSHPACVSQDGALDLMGNLHEWTSDPAGTFRGGFYVDTAINGEGCAYVTTAHGTSHWDYSTGFRCCAD